MIQQYDISSGCGPKYVDYLCITKTFHNSQKFHEIADKLGMCFFFFL